MHTGNVNWNRIWEEYIEKYLSTPPRVGVWIKNKFSSKKLSILEIAGGSCRDSMYLHLLGYNSVGSDLNYKVLSLIRKKFSNITFKLIQTDAFNLSFKDNSFDIVFSNGLLIYFWNDEDIFNLLKEQMRVARRYVVSIVHNKENDELVKKFAKLKEKDPLYDIRFFTREELLDIANKLQIKGKVLVEKFGGPADYLYLFEKKIPALRSVVRWLVPKLYHFQPWTRVERIVLIIELK